MSDFAPRADAPNLPEVPATFVRRIVEELHPEELWLFGSRALGHARPDSDWNFLAVLPNNAAERDLDTASVWRRLRDLRLRVGDEASALSRARVMRSGRGVRRR